jgi:hypothetical protein
LQPAAAISRRIDARPKRARLAPPNFPRLPAQSRTGPPRCARPRVDVARDGFVDLAKKAQRQMKMLRQCATMRRAHRVSSVNSRSADVFGDGNGNEKAKAHRDQSERAAAKISRSCVMQLYVYKAGS